jgi:tripartite ATP-independent transporter DctM subunit
MSPELIGLLGLVVMLVLLAFRMPVGFAMLLVGLAGYAILNSPTAALSALSSESFNVASNPDLLVIPLFILMGNVATEAGMSRKLYDAAYVWLGHLRGGLASATVAGCAGFAALCGSSVASALTMGRVSLDEMKRYNYAPQLSTGVVAAGGTLGILIPPSTGFVIYATLTQESIGKLFLAGVIPGILLSLLFIITIQILTWVKPELGPRGPTTTWAEKARATRDVLPATGIIFLSIGGIYFGFFSPVEASAVGVGLALLFGLAYKSLSFEKLSNALKDSIATTATLMLILIAAHIIGPFLALSHLPAVVGGWLTGLPVGPYGVLALILITYLILGCFMEGFSMLVLTMPIFYPVIVALGFDPIWFGVIVVITLEMGLITPPVGINVFIVKSVARDVPIGTIFRGVWPFLIAMIICVILLTLFPDLALYLPRTMIG